MYPVYTTVHAQDVPQTVTRMVDAFPWTERAQAASVLRANLRLIVHQRLVPRVRTEEDVRAGVRNPLNNLGFEQYGIDSDTIE